MLSENQKKIVDQILEGKVYDFASFLFENKLTKYECKNELNVVFEYFKTGYNNGEKARIFLNNEQNFYRMIIDLLSLFELLEKENYIIFTRQVYNDPICFDISLCLPQHKESIKILNKIFKNQDIFEFLPTSRLEEYQKRNYLNEKENDRTKTLNRALISMWISVIIFLVSTIINISIYTKDRDVNVKNYRDTTKVLIVNPQEKLSDTLQNGKDK
jgi:hypothetical protein